MQLSNIVKLKLGSMQVMKEGSGKKEKENVPIEIPPPRPKRKPLHPYPRKFVPTPNKSSTLCLSFHEVRKSTNLKTMESESHSPSSVLASEGTQSSTSHAKDVVIGSTFSLSSGSKLSHAVETCIMKDNSTLRNEKEQERRFSLTLNLSLTKADVLTNTVHFFPMILLIMHISIHNQIRYCTTKCCNFISLHLDVAASDPPHLILLF